MMTEQVVLDPKVFTNLAGIAVVYANRSLATGRMNFDMDAREHSFLPGVKFI